MGKSMMNLFEYSSFLIIILAFDVCTSQENLFTNERIQLGLVQPIRVDALAGEDVFLRLIETMPDQEKCLFHRNGAVDVAAPTNNVEQMKSEKCGIRIKNVGVDDTGLWRLTSSDEGNKRFVTGMAVVNVRENAMPKINGMLTYAPNMNIAPERTSYCYVVRPNEPTAKLPQHSKCTLPGLYDASDANGKWNVIAGITGRTEELKFDVNVETVQTFDEELKTSVSMDDVAHRLTLKCKLINTKKVMTFCRFMRMADEIGYNLLPGQGNDKYRYFGDGFDKHECGIAIANPDALDRGFWKCLIGTTQADAVNGMTVGAIVDGKATHTDSTRYDIVADDVYGLHGTSVNLLCKSNFPAEYCWFRHPNGRKISISETTITDIDSEQYNYFGSGIRLGDCGVTILNASVNDSGTWTCHMGRVQMTGLESSQSISVRVAESHLVSTSLFQDVPTGNALLVECKTVPEHIPIKYCRFVLPDGSGFSIDENSTSENPLLGNFYFNPNRQMKFGFCSIIVKHVTKKYIGQWTCAARLVARAQESWDDFDIHVFGTESPSAAAISGMVIGAIVMLGAIGGMAFFTFQRKNRLRRNRIADDNVSDTVSEMSAIPMDNIGASNR